MSCKNCFNGCASTTSDKCVKYTGITISALGITNGDSLFSIQENILEHILSLINGTGIVVTVSPGNLCALINSFLPATGDITLVDYTSALIQSVCSLQAQITTVDERVDTIEANYAINCLPGVAPSEGTHVLLQATIDFLCSLNTTVTALALDLTTNYTPTADLPALIAEAIGTEPASTLLKYRMIPFTVVEYYGSLGNFNGTGAGIGDWVDIYLCNGANGTPDKRGRVGVGATTGMFGGVMSPAVDPAVTGNPAYALLSAGGANIIALSVAQMPQHSHTATFTGAPHKHTFPPLYTKAGTTNIDVLSNSNNVSNISVTETSSVTATGTVSVNNTGNTEAHSNIQPVLACYYIMYIPT